MGNVWYSRNTKKACKKTSGMSEYQKNAEKLRRYRKQLVIRNTFERRYVGIPKKTPKNRIDKGKLW